MPGLPTADLGDGGHRPGPYPAALAALVRRHLPGHRPHAGFLGVAAAASTRSRALRDGLDDVAEATPRHGATRARPPLGHGGAGRDLPRWRRGRPAWRSAARQQEVDPGRRGRGRRLMQSGWAGHASGFEADEPNERGHKVIRLYVEEPEPRDGPPRPSARLLERDQEPG